MTFAYTEFFNWRVRKPCLTKRFIINKETKSRAPTHEIYFFLFIIFSDGHDALHNNSHHNVQSQYVC